MPRPLPAVKLAVRLLAHLLALSRGGGRALRWRLETYGLYMPSYPHQRPWWAINPWVGAGLARRLARYARWLDEIDRVRRPGSPGTWQHRLAPSADARWRGWIAAHNSPDPGGESDPDPVERDQT